MYKVTAARDQAIKEIATDPGVDRAQLDVELPHAGPARPLPPPRPPLHRPAINALGGLPPRVQFPGRDFPGINPYAGGLGAGPIPALPGAAAPAPHIHHHYYHHMQAQNAGAMGAMGIAAVNPPLQTAAQQEAIRQDHLHRLAFGNRPGPALINVPQANNPRACADCGPIPIHNQADDPPPPYADLMQAQHANERLGVQLVNEQWRQLQGRNLQALEEQRQRMEQAVQRVEEQRRRATQDLRQAAEAANAQAFRLVQARQEEARRQWLRTIGQATNNAAQPTPVQQVCMGPHALPYINRMQAVPAFRVQANAGARQAPNLVQDPVHHRPALVPGIFVNQMLHHLDNIFGGQGIPNVAQIPVPVPAPAPAPAPAPPPVFVQMADVQPIPAVDQAMDFWANAFGQPARPASGTNATQLPL